MSSTAAVSKVGAVTLHGRGPAALTVKILPVIISAHVRWIAAPVIGLAPTSPLIADGKTSVMPDLVRIAKIPAFPRGTGVCPVNSTALVVNVHAMGLSIATPAAFFAAVVTVAV